MRAFEKNFQPEIFERDFEVNMAFIYFLNLFKNRVKSLPVGTFFLKRSYPCFVLNYCCTNFQEKDV